MNEAYIPAIITASVALLAATGAQFLSHYLNIKREKKKNENEIYQEFIYPFLPEVLLYYDTETNFRKGHDVEQEVNLQDLLIRISQKVSYGNLKLLSAFYQIKKTDHFFDGRGYSKERNILRFMFWYLNYAIEILKEKQKKEKSDLLLEVERVQKLYGLWILLAEEMDFPLATELMKYDFYFYQSFLQEIDVDILREIIEIEPGLDKRRANFLKIMIREWERETNDYLEIPGLEDLKSHISSC